MTAAGTTRTAAPAAARGGAAAAPRAVTRGERVEGAAVAEGVRVDWLHATWDAARLSVDALVGMLGRIMGRPVRGMPAPGLFGFSDGLDLSAGVGSRWVVAGRLCWGGESQRGRCFLQLTGGGCGLVRDWQSLQSLLEDLEARVTRLDLAADFLAGEYTVDDAVRWHAEGGFSAGGRPPSTSVAGDWLGGVNGRTLYIGKAENGKLLRCYEKGKQLGEPESPWVRFEVQFGARDRVIPLEALTKREAFFAGAYPALAAIVADAAERMATDQEQAKVTLWHLLRHLKQSYGRVLDTAVHFYGVPYSDLIEGLRVHGLPRRLHPSGAESGLEPAQVLAGVEV